MRGNGTGQKLMIEMPKWAYQIIQEIKAEMINREMTIEDLSRKMGLKDAAMLSRLFSGAHKNTTVGYLQRMLDAVGLQIPQTLMMRRK